MFTQLAATLSPTLLAQSDGSAGLFAGMGILMLLVWGLALIGTVFWIWMLIDCLGSSMPTNEKILWFAVIFFLHLLGAVLYFVMVRGQRGTTATT